MEKRVGRLGYEVAFNPPGDGDCFYASAAKTLGIETQGPEEGDLRLSEYTLAWIFYSQTFFRYLPKLKFRGRFSGPCALPW